MNRRYRWLATFAVLAAAASGFSQSWSSFISSDWSDITVTSLGGQKFRLTLGNDPTITLLNQTVHVDFAFGFWALASTASGNLAASGVAQNGWNWDTSGTSVAGWHNPNKSHKLLHNQSYDFQFTGIDESKIATWGIHASTVEGFPGTEGQTGFTKAVPEPSAVAALMAGCVGCLSVVRRRRR